MGGAGIVRSAGPAGSPRPQHGVSLTVGCRAPEADPAPQGGGGGSGVTAGPGSPGPGGWGDGGSDRLGRSCTGEAASGALQAGAAAAAMDW